jgi:hypothetical protein
MPNIHDDSPYYQFSLVESSYPSVDHLDLDDEDFIAGLDEENASDS